MDRDSREFAIYTGGIVFLIIIIIFLWCIPARPLAEEYKASVTKALEYQILKNTPYVWGAASENKNDCSGMLYYCFRSSGVPVLRTTALAMSQGAAGWSGKDIELDDVEALNLIWWTWALSPRKHGHVGIFLEGKTGLLQPVHASQTRGVVMDKLEKKLLTDISKLRYLIIGDKK
jgi:hypothetical protein